MELKELLALSLKNQDLKLKDAYFHGEKIAALLKTLKKHVVSITFNYSFLNPANLPDLVIEYSGPSTGRFIFHGQLYSRPEIKANNKEQKIIQKERAKTEKVEQKKKNKELKELKNTFDGSLLWLVGLKGYIYTKKNSNEVLVLKFPGTYSIHSVDSEGFFCFEGQSLELKTLKKVV